MEIDDDEDELRLRIDISDTSRDGDEEPRTAESEPKTTVSEPKTTDGTATTPQEETPLDLCVKPAGKDGKIPDFSQTVNAHECQVWGVRYYLQTLQYLTWALFACIAVHSQWVDFFFTNMAEVLFLSFGFYWVDVFNGNGHIGVDSFDNIFNGGSRTSGKWM